jgi:hypothetical protein
MVLRYNEDGTPGWITDRGMALVGLGEPDQIIDQGIGDVGVRGRAQVWEYRQHRLQLVFVDQTGFGRWRLTTSSDADLQAVLRDALAHGWVAPGGLVVVERATRGGPWAWPEGYDGLRSRRYGEATLWYGRAALSDSPGE